jgi:NAD(P)-dependent dehydrogenase (short-subunit alcohol dehydrogenase family)
VAGLFKSRGWKISGLCDTKECNCKDTDAESCLCVNFADRDAVGKAVAEIEAKSDVIGVMFVTIPYLVKLPHSFVDTPIEWWQERLQAWLVNTSNLCFHMGKAMVGRKDGRIVLLSPDYKNVPGDCVLEATAAGTLHAFAKAFGAEVAVDGVLVNALSPNIPIDLDCLAETVFHLAENDTYTAAQVLSLHGKE